RMVSRRGRMARSVGTSARLISPPLDSKSGVRSSLSLIFLFSSLSWGVLRRTPQTPRVLRRREVVYARAARCWWCCVAPPRPVTSALQGGQGAEVRLLLLRLAALLPLLAVAAQQREGERLEAGGRDVRAALRAGAVGPGLQPAQGLVDAAERVRLHLDQ